LRLTLNDVIVFVFRPALAEADLFLQLSSHLTVRSKPNKKM